MKADNRARVAGGLAAAAALSAGELVTAGGSPSLMDSVGSQFIIRFSEPVESLAIELFGTKDKLALRVGIVVVSILIGAALGRVARRRLAAGAAGIAAFGAVGLVAALADPLASTGRSAFGAVFAVAVGVITLGMLLRAADDRPAAVTTERIENPATPLATRRLFLVFASATGVASVAGGVGARALRAGANGASRIAAIVLPRATRTTPLPADQPFHVEGLSPYVTPNEEFYRIDTALFIPRVNEATWKLRVKGMVERPFEVSYEELLAMDMVEEPITMSCVSNEIGGGLVGNASWLGVPLVTLLDRAGVKKGATQIVGRSVDGFTAGFPTEAVMDGRAALVAVGMNGEPLPQRHGFPARLVVSGLYGYVSATKWLRDIELTTLEDFDGYWIPRGWAKKAPVKLMSRIDVPRLGDRVAAGPLAIAGVAWCPSVGVERVEINLDDEGWQEAKLGNVASNNTWVQWVATVDVGAGLHSVEVRATDARGNVQTAVSASPPPDGATGHHKCTFVARWASPVTGR